MKKFLTFVLVLAMVMSVSSFAMAANGLPDAVGGKITLATGTYTLSDNVSLLADTCIEISAGAEVVLDLNGKTISGTHGTVYSMIHVLNGAKLTVKDTSDEQNGKITCAAGGNNIGANVWVEGALVLESGTIEITGVWTLGFAVDLRPNAWGTAHTVGASFVMNGGMVKATDTAVRVASNSSDDYEELGVTFTMNGGVIESDWDAIFVQHLYKGDLDINVKAGTVSGSNSAMRIYGDAGSDIDMIVTDGEFTGAIKVADAYATAEDVIVISGGTFSEDPSAYLADDAYSAEITEDGANSGDSETTLGFVVGKDEAGLKKALKEAVEEMIEDGKNAEKLNVIPSDNNGGAVAFVTGDMPGGVEVYGKATVNGATPSGGLPMPTPELPQETNKPSTGGGYYYVGVRYNGGNSFSTDRPDVPVAVLIDGQPVGFTGNGSNFVVDCINPDASRITIVWNTIKVDARFTPDANAYCAQAVIPKTGGMSFWAAIAQFLGF